MTAPKQDAVSLIERLDERGRGITSNGTAHAFTVPGDTITTIGGRDNPAVVVTPSPNHVAAICPYFERCGGCATQTVAMPVQLDWKRALVVDALARAGVDAPVAPCVDAHGRGRRRATFHARRGADGHTLVGFMAARTHDLVAIEECPLFAPEMSGALPAARRIATTLAATGKPLDIAVTATDAGLDVDVRGCGPLDAALEKALVASAERAEIARISNHGRPVVTFRSPRIAVGAIDVVLPPGGFLQATVAGETALRNLVLEAAGTSARIADLFSGIGTFALSLATRASVHAVEADRSALDALLAAARGATTVRPVNGSVRDLVRRPLAREELDGFDAIVFDPPRAGAAEQVATLAHSSVPLLVGVSCNPQTFARDARTLIDGGYRLEQVTPVDQFRHSAHVELVGVFRRSKARRKRSLLG